VASNQNYCTFTDYWMIWTNPHNKYTHTINLVQRF